MISLNMWNNILLYNNPFKDFFLKRHKNNFNVFIGMIFLIYLQSSDYVYLNTSRNQRQIMSRRWICKHEECGMSSLDQTDTPPYPTSSYSIWSPILRVIKIKKIFNGYGIALHISVEQERLIFMFTCLAQYMGNICNRKKFVEFCLQYKFSSQSCVAKPAVTF